VVATINKHKLLTKEKLQAAFALFDKDGSGTISADEVKDFLFQSANPNDIPGDEEWDRVIKQVDKDGNKEIDFNEFSIMMR
jgi:calcium-dependent protein kinase